MEGDEDLFPEATPEDLKRREIERIQRWDQYFESFKSRKDVFQRLSDGSFNVRGGVSDWGSKEGKHLALKYGSVMGNYYCGGELESLEGAPSLICGNFSFHGDLKSLNGFPKEIWGNVKFRNHPYNENRRRHAKRWTKADIKKVCDVRGTVKVKDCSGI